MDYSDETSAGPEPVSPPALVEKPERLTDAREPKKGPPKLDEWQDFFSRFLIRLIVNGYLTFALGDLVEDLSPSELDAITLSKDEMREMAAPFATVAHGSPLAQKHGRSIIAMADSYESILNFLFWMRRVNRIARRHGGKPKRQPRRPRTNQRNRSNQGANNAGHDGNSPAQADGTTVPGTIVVNPYSG